MIAMRILIILSMFFMIVSCQSRDRFIAQKVVDWEGKEILFPKQIPFFINGKDTTNSDWFQSDYKIVTYLDSTGCSGCRLQLSRWKEFIGCVDSLNSNVRFFFYLHPKNVNSIKHLIKRNNFKYPVCYDLKGEFHALNHLLPNTAFHTFLLDKHNRIIAIGNPINSFRIRDLYINILMNKFTSDTLKGG